LQIVNTICSGGVGDALNTRDLAVLRGDDQLADLGMRDSVLAAIAIKALAPGDTAACLQTACLLVKPPMNDLAVARRSLKPDRRSALENKHMLPGQRQRLSGRKPDNPGTDDLTFNFVQLAPRGVIKNRRIRPQHLLADSAHAVGELLCQGRFTPTYDDRM